MRALDSSGAAPVFCTLSAGAMGPRLTRIRQVTRAHLQTHDLQGSRLRLSYAPGAATELAAIVELERECCAFLEFHVTVGKDTVELLIVGPPQEVSDAKWLFSQFLPDSLPPGGSTACGGSKG